MKLITADKVLVELTRQDLELLQNCLLNAYLRMTEKQFPNNILNEIDTLSTQLHIIEKNLPK